MEAQLPRFPFKARWASFTNAMRFSLAFPAGAWFSQATEAKAQMFFFHSEESAQNLYFPLTVALARLLRLFCAYACENHALIRLFKTSADCMKN